MPGGVSHPSSTVGIPARTLCTDVRPCPRSPARRRFVSRSSVGRGAGCSRNPSNLVSRRLRPSTQRRSLPPPSGSPRRGPMPARPKRTRIHHEPLSAVKNERELFRRAPTGTKSPENRGFEASTETVPTRGQAGPRPAFGGLASKDTPAREHAPRDGGPAPGPIPAAEPFAFAATPRMDGPRRWGGRFGTPLRPPRGRRLSYVGPPRRSPTFVRR